MFRSVSFTGALFLLFGSAVSAQTGQRSLAPRSEDPFEFVAAFVESLGWAHQGWNVLLKTPPDLQEQMLSLKRADREYLHAASLVEAFLKSNDEAIEIGATASHRVYIGQIELNAKSAAKIKAVLNEPQRAAVGSILEFGAEMQASREELWRLLFMAAAPAASHALAEVPDNPNAKATRLRLTATQRRELMGTLERTFGPSVRQDLMSGVGYIEGAGRVLFSLLADRRWASLDQR